MRKKFPIVVQLMITLAFILGACASPATPQVEPQVIKETVVVTQEVPVEKIVEKEKIVVQAPSEYSLTALSPQGAIPIVADLAGRLDTLDGKTVAMWLSATADETYAGLGEPLYDELAKLLKEKFPAITIVPYSELPLKYSPADEVIAAITETKPDAVVIGFGG